MMIAEIFDEDVTSRMIDKALVTNFAMKAKEMFIKGDLNLNPHQKEVLFNLVGDIDMKSCAMGKMGKKEKMPMTEGKTKKMQNDEGGKKMKVMKKNPK